VTVLLEIDTVTRFASRQQFCSYAGLITPKQESSGKVVGVGNAKAGNAWLKWAFSEAAVLGAQKDERMKRCLAKLQSRHGDGEPRVRRAGETVLTTRTPRPPFDIAEGGCRGRCAPSAVVQPRDFMESPSGYGKVPGTAGSLVFHPAAAATSAGFTASPYRPGRSRN
jgi:hypothetical protein